nr:MAG TPA: hypothetical protein [Herelleviridae sp.]
MGLCERLSAYEALTTPSIMLVFQCDRGRFGCLKRETCVVCI